MSEPHSLDEGEPRSSWYGSGTRGVPPGERGPRLDDSPRLSVVLVSGGDRAKLKACLASLLPQCSAHAAELIVACAGPIGELETTYPTVMFLGAPRDASLATLRSSAVATSEGDVIAVVEDHNVPASDWLAQLVATPRGGAELPHDARENDRRRAAQAWTADFAEFDSYLRATPGMARS